MGHRFDVDAQMVTNTANAQPARTDRNSVSDQQIRTLIIDSDLSQGGLAATSTKVNKNQFALDVGGLLNHSISYARRVGDTNLSVGVGLGFGWELNSHSFERDIWNAGHIVVFGRYQLSNTLQVDLGPTLLGYVWADDCSECTDTFVGLQLVALAGYRFVFIGPWVRTGFADDRKHGSEFGTIWGLQARLALSWGR
ncbi:MAG: hypothetical protein ACE5IY_21900 [bacterium]